MEMKVQQFLGTKAMPPSLKHTNMSQTQVRGQFQVPSALANSAKMSKKLPLLPWKSLRCPGGMEGIGAAAPEWEYLKTLPNKLVRDIAFVIASPSLLLDSNELPMVDIAMLGGGNNLMESEKWLGELGAEQVAVWFKDVKNSSRLADMQIFGFLSKWWPAVALHEYILRGIYFAACIEYVLLFSPAVKARHLFTSQQVLHTVAENSVSLDEELIEKELATIMENISLSKDKSNQCNGPPPQDGTNDDSPSEESGLLSMPEDLLKMGKRKKKLLWKLHQREKNRKRKVVILGEFDFLFELRDLEAKSPERQDNLALDEIQVEHWEVSVKFLLYAGPWEAFGFITPISAVAVAGQFRISDSAIMSQQSGDLGNVLSSFGQEDEFLGCFIGPHAGESLYSIKTRLATQLALSQNEHAASFVYDLFAGPRPQQSGFTEPPTIRVFPRALLKGYLFYEYGLWHSLLLRRETRNCNVESFTSNTTRDHNLESIATIRNPNLESISSAARNPNLESTTATSSPNPECANIGKQSEGLKSSLNPDHWMGWWTPICNFTDFAFSPLHENSKWYIVPKKEWLSPIVIIPDDHERSARVLDVSEFLKVAANVAEEAERSEIPQKHRFMVAEVAWRPDHVNIPHNRKGAWVEISRGFVVEETWPDSRLNGPHGNVPSWSPALSTRL